MKTRRVNISPVRSAGVILPPHYVIVLVPESQEDRRILDDILSGKDVLHAEIARADVLDLELGLIDRRGVEDTDFHNMPLTIIPKRG